MIQNDTETELDIIETNDEGFIEGFGIVDLYKWLERPLTDDDYSLDDYFR